MLVEAGQRREDPGAKVTLVSTTVPGLARRLVRVGAVPADQPLRDEAIRILLSDKSVQFVTVEALGPRTCTSLEMVRQARGRSEIVFAEGALDGSSDVSAGPQVLFRVSIGTKSNI